MAFQKKPAEANADGPVSVMRLGRHVLSVPTLHVNANTQNGISHSYLPLAQGGEERLPQ